MNWGSLMAPFKKIILAQIVFLVLLPNILFAHDDHHDHDEVNSPKKLVITPLQDLAFGEIIIDNNSGGNVTIDPEGKRTVNIGFVAGGHYSFAEFEIIGEPNKKIEVIFPQSITIYGKSGRNSATVSNFTGFFPDTHRHHNQDNRIVGKIKEDGKIRLQVGGTVVISPGTNGEMSGSSDLSLDYSYHHHDDHHDHHNN